VVRPCQRNKFAKKYEGHFWEFQNLLGAPAILLGAPSKSLNVMDKLALMLKILEYPGLQGSKMDQDINRNQGAS